MLIVALLAIIVLLVLSIFPVSLDNEKLVSNYPVHPCKTLTTGCKANIGNTEVEIKFPDNIVFLKRFPIELRIPDKQHPVFEKVSVDFQMVDMNMGLNFYQLKQHDKDKSLWTGKGVLPVCTTGRTDWQAIISLQQGKQVQRVAFQFEVDSATQ